jgi:hypothetical protein
MRYALLAVALLASATAFADCDEHGPPMARLKQELNLTDAQATQVEQILRAGHERAMTAHESERDNMRSQMEAIHQDTLNQLRGILSEDQIQTLESHMKDHRGWHHGEPDDASATAEQGA